MAEILIKAQNATNTDGVKDQRGCYKRGMAVVVKDDGHTWGAEEGLPKFVLFKFPLIDKSRVEKFLQPDYLDDAQPSTLVRRRRWQVRYADLPLAARNKLINTGELIIKATAEYTGAFDYTWTQIKSFFRNLQTGLDETGDI